MASNEEDPKWEKLTEYLNAVLGSAVSMHSEIKELSADVSLQCHMWQEQRKEWDNRLSHIEDFRKSQMLAADEQVAKIKSLEEKGFTLTIETVLPHLLGSTQLLYEEVGKQTQLLEQLKDGMVSVDKRIVEYSIEQKLLLQKVDELSLITTEMREDNRTVTKKLLKVLLFAVLGILALAGFGALWDAIRMGGFG